MPRPIHIYSPLVGATTELAAAYDNGDGLHPNAAGQAVIAGKVVRAIRRII